MMASGTLGVDTVILNKNTDDELICHGYRDHLCKRILFYLLCIPLLGLPILVLYWKPGWSLKVKKVRCPLARADAVALINPFKQIYIAPVVIEYILDGPRAVGKYVYLEHELFPSSADVSDRTVLTNSQTEQRACFRYFEHCHMRYIWDKDLAAFVRLMGIEEDVTCADIHDKFHGLTVDEEFHRIYVYGENVINVDVKSYPRLFVEEVLNPFYIFQICSIVLWSIDNYYVYASCIFLISAISLLVSLYETKKQSVTLATMVKSKDYKVSVMRKNSDLEEVPTSRLVPGDVIIIPAHGCIMNCDAVLVSGGAIVNESMLTGESVPVTKTALAPDEASETFNPETHKRHVLFSGTHVIQTRYYGDIKVKAVVVRTGFSTAKGELVRSILFPKPMDFKFYEDSMKFVGVLALVAMCGMCYTVYILLRNGAMPWRIAVRALDIVTIVVPPALPAALTVGTVYAQNRLKKANIFCISPPRINVCGKLSCVVFDKTGTLTEDGLDMWGVVPIDNHVLQAPVRNPSELPCTGHLATAMATCHSLTLIDGELTGDPLDLNMFNSINWLLEEPGKDTSKFDSLMPTIVKPITRDTYYSASPEETPFEVGIIRQFTFSSGLQRMSVITRTLGHNHMDVYCKGAPEKIATLCRPETVPDNFHAVLHRYTIKGFRVIALAHKQLPTNLTWHHAQRKTRDEVESELALLGLLVMENTLKPQTTPAIKQLSQANIRTVMATGDNMLTALSVARQCGMVASCDRVILIHAHPPETVEDDTSSSSRRPACIQWELAEHQPDLDEVRPNDVTLNTEGLISMEDSASSVHGGTDEQALYQQGAPVALPVGGGDESYHFAITGRSFALVRRHFPELLDKITVRGTIFARMSPDQKSMLVEYLQDLGHYVGMCGDGANDCGALKTAHAGISLSEAEASVASPFTSRTANIECVPTVIREGRAALVTSFGVFKYMAMYSIIQFVSVLILYTFETNLGDWMFLFIDLFTITSLVILMGHTDAYGTLVAQKPRGSLIAPVNIISLAIHITLVICFQAAAYLYLANQHWYTPNEAHGETKHTKSMETTVIFYISQFQYLFTAYIFSTGPPFRKPIYTNVAFLVTLLVLTAATLLIVLHPFDWLISILQMVKIPSIIFSLTIVGMAAVNFLLSLLVEWLLVDRNALRRLVNCVRRKHAPKSRYKLVDLECRANLLWPPTGHTTYATQQGINGHGNVHTGVGVWGAGVANGEAGSEGQNGSANKEHAVHIRY